MDEKSKYGHAKHPTWCAFYSYSYSMNSENVLDSLFKTRLDRCTGKRIYPENLLRKYVKCFNDIERIKSLFENPRGVAQHDAFWCSFVICKTYKGRVSIRKLAHDFRNVYLPNQKDHPFKSWMLGCYKYA